MNQQETKVDREQTESLVDLEVTAEKADDAIAGSTVESSKVSLRDFHFVVQNGSTAGK